MNLFKSTAAYHEMNRSDYSINSRRTAMDTQTMPQNAPVMIQATQLQSGESHFYSFYVTETEKQWMGYKPLDRRYLCHVTDQRLIFEPQFLLIASATLPNLISHAEIKTLKLVRTLSGTHASIVLHPNSGQTCSTLVLAVSGLDYESSQQRYDRASAFVHLTRQILESNPTRSGNSQKAFQFDAKAIAQFEQEIQASPIPVLVDFWASGCEPCRVIEPMVQDFLSQFAGRVKLVKVDIERSPSVPMRYEVDCFPTLLMFKEGVVVEKITGVVPQPLLVKALKRHLVEQ
jgi:thioredoxin 1